MRAIEFLQGANQKLATCSQDETMEAVAVRLSERNIGALPVCAVNGALVGIVSERDLVRSFAKDPARLREKRVRDLMTRDVVTCRPDTDMAAAEKLMNQHRIRHLPVVEGAKLVGMLSIRDALAGRLRESREEVNVLRDAVIAARHR